MRRIEVLSFILAFLFLVNLIFSYVCYKRSTKIQDNLELLIVERDNLLLERNLLKSDLNYSNSQLELLTEDVKEIYKSCIGDNACKGHYPGVRWYCNNVGDSVSDPSHVCVCDASCNLNATLI